MVVKTKCSKCGVTINLDFGTLTREEAAEVAKRMDETPRECPGGHVELCGFRRLWNMDDAIHRAYDPQQTLEHWHYVRSSELRNIIPYINTTDYIVNSGLPYELPIMRARLFARFEKWVELYQDDPLHTDALMRAERVHRLLSAITPVEDDSAIPPDSLLREFIGGSCYEY